VTGHILICDDEPHILRAAEFKLKRAGFEVQCAVDGEQAWRLIWLRRPDILITDCQMPRLDGIGLIQRIRAHHETADLPVLILTAKGFELSRVPGFDGLGVLDLIGKPFSPRALLQRIEQILAARGTQ
jgi:DNA-binding response OmpR family regulator